MRILVTGICGFVGSTLAEALIDHSDPTSLSLTGIDNLSRPGSWLNRERLVQRGISVLHGDVRQASDLDAIGPFDWIIDAAANPSVLAGVDGRSSSRQLVEHNLLGTINLLEACKRWHAGFILLSSSRVYSIPPLAALPVEVHNHAYRPVFGGQKTEVAAQASEANEPGQPSTNQQFGASTSTRISLGSPAPGLATPPIGPNGITESFSTSPPVSLYGATKLASETLALEYGLAYQFPVWINRCGVMAGARQFGKADQGIFAFWIHSWREGRPLRYIGFDGLGHQVRDCLHPRDLAPLVLTQMGKSRKGTADSSQNQETNNILNISGGLRSAMSLRQLSTWCSNRFPQSTTASTLPDGLTHQPPEIRPYDLPWVVLDHSVATKMWNWQPEIKLYSILQEIADFAEKNPNWMSISG